MRFFAHFAALLFTLFATQAVSAADQRQISDVVRYHSANPIPAYRDARGLHLPPITDGQIDAHISPTLSPADRAVIRNVMLQLPDDHRYNVIYYALDGKVYANNPALLKTVKAYLPSFSDQRTGVARDGSTIPLAPMATVRPNAYNCAAPPGSYTGGFREVYSRCNTPYDLATVYLPCASNGDIHFSYPNSETAYIYMGGFSGAGYAIDAGMQFSNKYNDWALFIRQGLKQNSNYTRYQCNQTIQLEFHPVSTTLLADDVLGYQDNGSFLRITQTFDVPASEFWSPSCPSCIVKRVSSLAQNGFLNVTDGSYVGIDVYTNPLIAWANADVGYWTGTYPARYNLFRWTSAYTGGYQSYPADPSRIIVRFFDSGQETDGIYLHS